MVQSGPLVQLARPAGRYIGDLCRNFLVGGMVIEMSGFFEYVGAVHLHSCASDGTLPIPEIAEIAAEKPLDFLMFSDHNTLAPKREGLEKWYGNVLVLIGCELNDDNDRNHYLAFRVDEEIPEKDPAAYVRNVHEQGGFGVIAHPFERRRFSSKYPAYPWTAWDVEGCDGIELWNQLSEWIEGVTYGNIFWRIMHPLRSIRFPVKEALDLWDRWNRDRLVVGMGGIDVHAHQIKILGLIPMEVYPYKVQFKSIRTHILTDVPLFEKGSPIAFDVAEKAVYNALIKGRTFVSNYSLGDARGFNFTFSNRSETFLMGSRLPKGEKYMVQVNVPNPAKIRLMRDGQLIEQFNGAAMERPVHEPGVYRIEVIRKRKGWIYSNPIVIMS